MEKIKIAIIYPTDPLGRKVGGAETFLKGLVKYAPEDFDIEFIGITSNPKERFPKKWVKLKLGNKQFNFFPLFFEKDENRKTLFPLSFRFTIALKFSQIDISDRILFFNRIEPAVLFRNTKSSKIAIIHSDTQKVLQEKSEVIWRRFSRLYFAFEKFIFHSLNCIYTVNKKTLKFYRLKYPEQKDKFCFLSTWVDGKIFYPHNKPKEQLRQDFLLKDNHLPFKGKWVLFVGRLQEVKAPLRLIQAFFEYHKINKESCLLIIGKGNLEKKIKSYIKELSLGQAVYLLGIKDALELAKYYNTADVMLLTSNFEGMPMCVLEALACGLPVVSTNVGETKRVVKNGYSGEIVESFLPEVISQSVKKVLDNPKIYPKDNCVKTVSEYTPQKVLRPMYETIKRLYKERCMVRKMRQVDICNIRIDSISRQEVLKEIEALIEKKGASYIVTPNVDHIVKLQKDLRFKQIYNEAVFVLPDGKPLMWAAKLLGTPLKEKISGSDLFLKLCSVAEEKGYKLFFLGGRPGAASKTFKVLKNNYPVIQITGTYSPSSGFENDIEENKKIVKMIKDTNSDILFVGLGAPRQEKWIYKYKDKYQVPVSIGIGASFEFVAGIVKRAPVWMQKTGLEWFWRLIMEPKRLWRRYLIDDMKFFWLVFKQKMNQIKKNNKTNQH